MVCTVSAFYILCHFLTYSCKLFMCLYFLAMAEALRVLIPNWFLLILHTYIFLESEFGLWMVIYIIIGRKINELHYFGQIWIIYLQIKTFKYFTFIFRKSSLALYSYAYYSVLVRRLKKFTAIFHIRKWKINKYLL